MKKFFLLRRYEFVFFVMVVFLIGFVWAGEQIFYYDFSYDVFTEEKWSRSSPARVFVSGGHLRIGNLGINDDWATVRVDIEMGKTIVLTARERIDPTGGEGYFLGSVSFQNSTLATLKFFGVLSCQQGSNQHYGWMLLDKNSGNCNGVFHPQTGYIRYKSFISRNETHFIGSLWVSVWDNETYVNVFNTTTLINNFGDIKYIKFTQPWDKETQWDFVKLEREEKNISIRLLSPTNNITLPTNNVYFSADVKNTTPAIEIVNVSLLINGTINETNTSGISGIYNFNKTLPDGFYNWTIIAFGNDSRQYTPLEEISYFRIDTTFPFFVIHYPTEIINYSVLNGSLQLNWSVIGSNLDKCWYNYNGTNITLSNCISDVSNLANITLTKKNNVTFYANNTAGNLNFTEYSWSSLIFENSINFNPNTAETKNETFILNVTFLNNSFPHQARFYYDNKDMGLAIKNISGNDTIFISNIIIPLGTGNKTFYWTINTENYSFNTTKKEQEVLELKIDNCTINSFLILNYTIRDEDEFSFIGNTTNRTANLYVKLTADQSGKTYVYYANRLTDNPILICVSPALENEEIYLVDAEIQYTAKDYVIEHHHLDKMKINLSNAPLNITLLLLKTVRSQEFLITVKDKNFIPLKGAIIELTRQYLNLGKFLTVETVRTNNEGQGIGHFVLNDEVYTILIKKENKLLAVFDNVRAFCSNVPLGDCRINLNIIGTTIKMGDFDSRKGVSFTQGYNKTTKKYSVFFVVDEGITKKINLTVKKFDSFLNETICSVSMESVSGLLVCDIPEKYLNSVAIAKIHVNDEEIFQNVFSLSFKQIEISDYTKYFLAFIVILSLPLLAITSGTMALVFFLFGFFATGTLFLLDFGSFIGGASAFLWAVVTIGIILWKINRGKE